jgi:hypothetical protein
MSICRYCGEEITFRYIDGILRPIHPYGMPCGERAPYSDDSLKRAVHIRCTRCSQMVWLIRHNGGKVWVNELGWPWPKHGCFDSPNVSRCGPASTKGDGSTSRSTLADRGWRKCEFCERTIQLNLYADHLQAEHKRRQATVLAASLQKPRPQNKCEFCPAIVTPDRYARHLKRIHWFVLVGETEPMSQSTEQDEEDSRSNRSSERIESNRTEETPVASTDAATGLRPCEYCGASVRLDRYDRHVKKVHANGAGLDRAVQSAPALTIQGVGGKSVSVSAGDLCNLEQHTVNTTDNGVRAIFECVLLTDVLRVVDRPIGDKFQNTAGWYYVLAEARNGSRAVFSWAELDSTFMEKPVYVATKRDGIPLSKSDGPFRLVVPGDRRSARWIRQLKTVRIKQAN